MRPRGKDKRPRRMRRGCLSYRVLCVASVTPVSRKELLGRLSVRDVEIEPKVLSAILTDLVRRGLLLRVRGAGSPWFRYALSAAGEEMLDRVEEEAA